MSNSWCTNITTKKTLGGGSLPPPKVTFGGGFCYGGGFGKTGPKGTDVKMFAL